MLAIFRDNVILGELFAQYALDHDVNVHNEAELRCAIKAYSHYVLNTLVDRYEVGEREGEL